ncbi:MAG TPA: hypothetical protein DCS93_33945 [Microscillaceae bacterium]|nr:hypothetical protein [Microscillaceae bacterium]
MSYQIFTTLKRGYTHPLFCEDFLFTHQLGQRYVVTAVMDGSSMGDTSFFAATLVAKLLRKVCTQISYSPEFTPDILVDQLGELLSKQLFHEFKQARSALFLSKEETFTTLMLAVTDQVNEQSWVVTIGDGVLVVNDELQVFNQDNQPDYLGYYLHQTVEEWWSAQAQINTFSQVKRLALATDGVLAVDFASPVNDALAAAKELLTTPLLSDKPYALDQLLSQWLKTHEATPQDDIAIVCLQPSLSS